MGWNFLSSKLKHPKHAFQGSSCSESRLCVTKATFLDLGGRQVHVWGPWGWSLLSGNSGKAQVPIIRTFMYIAVSLLYPGRILGTYWSGGSSFSVISFCLFILFMGFSRQEILKWFAIPFSSGPRFVQRVRLSNWTTTWILHQTLACKEEICSLRLTRKRTNGENTTSQTCDRFTK